MALSRALGAVVFVALGCGPAPTGKCQALSEAQPVAQRAIAAAVPGAVLNELLGGPMTDDGRLASSGDAEWTFNAHRPRSGGGYDYSSVTVAPDCRTAQFNPGGATAFTAIPEYLDAAGWLQTATQVASDRGVTFNLRLLQVRTGEDSYPQAAVTAIVYFHQAAGGDPRDPRLIVFVDADHPGVVVGVQPD